MKSIVSLSITIALLLVLGGCAVSSPKNVQGTSAQAVLSQSNFTVVESGVKGEAQMTVLGIRMLSGEPFGIVLAGDRELTTVAMDNLRVKAGLKGTSRALVNVTEELSYNPWIFIYHKVKKTITADVVQFK